MSGEWRTLRSPPASPEAREALSLLLSVAASEARRGNGGRAIAMRRAIDVLRDFVIYEPKDDDNE